MERLDKILARELNIPRSEAKALVKSGAITVNGTVVRAPEQKAAATDRIENGGVSVSAARFVYLMMNKPAGVICASDGKGEKTVVDLLPDGMRRKGLFPAGRLDKDTTGFVLLTDDGAFAHDILSPSRHVDKTYIATLDKPIDDAVIADFEAGMTLGDTRLQPAALSAVDGDACTARVVLRQGLYHQVKRMFLKHGRTVTALRRIQIGQCPLDATLREGEARYLTPEELLLIKA